MTFLTGSFQGAAEVSESAVRLASDWRQVCGEKSQR